MSSPNVCETEAVKPSVPSFPWILIAWTGLLLLVSYMPVLIRLVKHWIQDEDMGHGFFVPVVAAYIVWQRREAILSERYTANWWGLGLVIFAAAQLLVATLGVELFLARTAFIFSIAGMVLFLGGMPLLRKVAFPIALLCFMVPLPAIIYNQITFPLQLFASRVAEMALSILGIPVLREGNILELPSQRLSVVEACSGIRSLLSLSFLSLVYGYFFDGRSWMRAALLAATIPIAILANSLRVTITGLVSEWDPELASGLFHSMEGWVIFVAALVMLLAFHKAADKVFHRYVQR